MVTILEDLVDSGIRKLNELSFDRYVKHFDIKLSVDVRENLKWVYMKNDGGLWNAVKNIFNNPEITLKSLEVVSKFPDESKKPVSRFLCNVFGNIYSDEDFRKRDEPIQKVVFDFLEDYRGQSARNVELIAESFGMWCTDEELEFMLPYFSKDVTKRVLNDLNEKSFNNFKKFISDNSYKILKKSKDANNSDIFFDKLLNFLENVGDMGKKDKALKSLNITSKENYRFQSTLSTCKFIENFIDVYNSVVDKSYVFDFIKLSHKFDEYVHKVTLHEKTISYIKEDLLRFEKSDNSEPVVKTKEINLAVHLSKEDFIKALDFYEENHLLEDIFSNYFSFVEDELSKDSFGMRDEGKVEHLESLINVYNSEEVKEALKKHADKDYVSKAVSHVCKLSNQIRKVRGFSQLLNRYDGKESAEQVLDYVYENKVEQFLFETKNIEIFEEYSEQKEVFPSLLELFDDLKGKEDLLNKARAYLKNTDISNDRLIASLYNANLSGKLSETIDVLETLASKNKAKVDTVLDVISGFKSGTSFSEAAYQGLFQIIQNS